MVSVLAPLGWKCNCADGWGSLWGYKYTARDLEFVSYPDEVGTMGTKELLTQSDKLAKCWGCTKAVR